jgi:hypothetical protein
MRTAVRWLVLLLTLIAASAAGVAPVRAAPVSVTLDAGRVSLSAEEAPAGDVLAAIAKASGVVVHVDPAVRAEALEQPLSLKLERLDVERALAQVLDPAHYVFLYSPAGLAEVRVYSWTPATSRPAAVGRAPETKAAEPEEDADDAKNRAEALRASRESVAAADPEARRAALERVSELGDAALITRTALEVLQTDRNAEVLDAALDLLADQEGVAAEPLLQFAETTPDRDLRVRTLEILAEQSPKDPRVAGLVRSLASRDRDPDFRETAAELLRSLAAQ